MEKAFGLETCGLNDYGLYHTPDTWKIFDEYLLNKI